MSLDKFFDLLSIFAGNPLYLTAMWKHGMCSSQPWLFFSKKNDESVGILSKRLTKFRSNTKFGY
jgi:hypothetical protein